MPSRSDLCVPDRMAAPGRRNWRRSAWIATACFAIGAIMLSLQLSSLEELHGTPLPAYYESLVAVDFLIGLLAVAIVGPMHRCGRWNYLLLFCTAVSTAATGAAAVALVRLGTRRSRADNVLAVLIPIGAGLFNAWIADDPHFKTEAFLAGPVIGATAFGLVAWGRSRADRAELVESLHREAASARREKAALERANRSLERSRQAEVARVRAEERSALARDMHDSLSHHMSLIAMHAGALSFREDLTSEQVRSTARTLRDAAESANSELASLLSTLRGQTSDRRDTEPLAGEGALGGLVTAARERGQDIEFAYRDMDSADVELFDGATRAALRRIVAELIVNAEKYAAGQRLTLVLGHAGSELIIHASNPVRPKITGDEPLGTGMGLIGIDERARLLGGSASHNDRSGHFTVEVRIPWHTK